MNTEPTFVTARLRVWEFTAVCNDLPGSCSRKILIASVRDTDWPGVAVSMSIFPEYHNYVDWIETSAPMRRQGYASELIRAVEQRYGPVQVDGVTLEGEALSEALERTEPKEQG